MDEEEEQDYYEFEGEAYGRKFRPVDALVLTVGLAKGIVGAVHQTLSAALILVASHANYNVERAMFAEQAALEIETMTGEQDV